MTGVQTCALPISLQSRASVEVRSQQGSIIDNNDSPGNRRTNVSADSLLLQAVSIGQPPAAFFTDLPEALEVSLTGALSVDVAGFAAIHGTIGTTNVPFAQFSSAGAYLAGNGLSLNGSTFVVVGTANRVTVGAGGVDIASTYVGQNTITTLGTVGTGTWNASTITVSYGGTGATTLTGYVKGNGTSAMTASSTIPNTDISGLGTISTSNPNLRPWNGRNLDVALEYYTQAGGLFSVGAYRRALSSYDVKLQAIPLLSQAFDEPSAFEVLRDGVGPAAVVVASGLAADAGDVSLGSAAAERVPSVGL